MLKQSAALLTAQYQNLVGNLASVRNTLAIPCMICQQHLTSPFWDCLFGDAAWILESCYCSSAFAFPPRNWRSKSHWIVVGKLFASIKNSHKASCISAPDIPPIQDVQVCVVHFSTSTNTYLWPLGDADGPYSMFIPTMEFGCSTLLWAFVLWPLQTSLPTVGTSFTLFVTLIPVPKLDNKPESVSYRPPKRLSSS